VEAGPGTFHAKPPERQRPLDRFKKLTQAEEAAMANKATRALEAAKHEVERQSELAVESTNKVRGLERDRQNMVHSFNSRLAVLNGNISECERAQIDADRLLQVYISPLALLLLLLGRCRQCCRQLLPTVTRRSFFARDRTQSTGFDECVCFTELSNYVPGWTRDLTRCKVCNKA
jgi:hypothetical protein